MKEEAKAKVWQEDKALMEQYAATLEAQERARAAQVEKLKQWQVTGG